MKLMNILPNWVFNREWIIVVVIVVGCVWGVWAFTDRIMYVQERNLAIHLETAYDFGAKARKHGVTSESNPYKYTYERNAWLDGWMETNRYE